MMLRRLRSALPILALVTTAANAQPPAPAAIRPFTLDEALAYATDHYPAAAAAVEDANIASGAVAVAKAAALPRLDVAYQANRATFNNMAGLLLPQSAFPGLSGPPLPGSSSQTAWGTALGALLTWEPFDFGARAAGIAGADAGVMRARAATRVTHLDVQGAVGAAFLGVALADEAVRAADADVQRRTVVARAVHALVEHELRPGADASRADAERAAAETRAILARRGLALARAEFTRFLGYTDGEATADATALLANTPLEAASGPTAPPAPHPLLLSRQASIDLARAQRTAIEQAFRPRLLIQSAVTARGSGVLFTGGLERGASGLGLERMNWAIGIQALLPNPFELGSRRAKRAAADAAVRAEVARGDETRLLLVSQRQAAAAMLAAARAVAATVPAQLTAAHDAERLARARYDAGLASLAELADAQGLLAQAEYQSALTRVEIWRALLAHAVAEGDLQAFTARATAARGHR